MKKLPNILSKPCAPPVSFPGRQKTPFFYPKYKKKLNNSNESQKKTQKNKSAKNLWFEMSFLGNCKCAALGQNK